MEKKSRSSSNRGIEENIMAIIDSSGIKEARDVHDDRLAFLEAVRAAYLVSDSGAAPSRKMFEAIFHILKDSTSLELIMTSYQLLVELDKHFPRLNLSLSDRTIEPVVVEEAWSPFSLGLASVCNEEACYRNSGNPLDSLGFSHLIKNIAQEFDEANIQVPAMKLVGDMMLFQYLVNVLEQDFVSRSTVYKDAKNWSLLRESILNMLLGSRRIAYKGLMKDCVSILSKECHHVTLSNIENAKESSGRKIDSSDVALYTSYSELQRGTYMAMQKFLCQIMELDIIKKQADIQGQTSRTDGLRTPLLEIILDELAYDEELFSRFLQVFSDPKWKLEIILQYFSKYLTKPSIHTRRSSSSSEDATLNGVLSSFSSETSTKSIVKKISTEVAQLLLAHAFQAYLKLQRCNEHITDSTENVRGSSIVKICQDIIAAFHNLRTADKHMEIMPIGREALYTAAAIVSMKC